MAVTPAEAGPVVAPTGNGVTSNAAPEGSDLRRWRALLVTQIAAFMVLLDVSIVNVALPSIERGMSMSPATAQWVVLGYALTLGLVLVPAGRLGDAIGRRRMFLIALAAFTLTSALTGAAPSPALLIAARLLQGVAGGLLIPQNTGLVQDLFRGAERGRAFGIVGGTIGLATAVGPGEHPHRRGRLERLRVRRERRRRRGRPLMATRACPCTTLRCRRRCSASWPICWPPWASRNGAGWSWRSPSAET